MNNILITLLFFSNYNLSPIFFYFGIPSELDLLLVIGIFFHQLINFFMRGKFNENILFILILLCAILSLNFISFSLIEVAYPVLNIIISFFLVTNILNQKNESFIIDTKKYSLYFIIFSLIGLISTACYFFIVIDLNNTPEIIDRFNRQGLALFFIIILGINYFFQKLFNFHIPTITLVIFLVGLPSIILLQSRTLMIVYLFYFMFLLIDFGIKRSIKYLLPVTVLLIIYYFEQITLFAPRLFDFSISGSADMNSIQSRILSFINYFDDIIYYPFNRMPMNEFLSGNYPHNFLLEIAFDFGILIAAIVAFIFIKNFFFNLKYFYTFLPIYLSLLVSYSIYNSKIFFFLFFLNLYFIFNFNAYLKKHE